MLIMASPLSAQKKIERRMPLGMEGAFRIMNMVGSVVIHGWNKDTHLIRGASSDAGISTVSGPVKIEGGVFERTKIETVTGNVSFNGRLDRSGTFDFDTHSGSIDIAIPDKTSASFSVVTIAGTIANNVSRTVPSAGRFGRGSELTTEIGDGGAKISVRTFKGSVTLRRSK